MIMVLILAHLYAQKRPKALVQVSVGDNLDSIAVADLVCNLGRSRNRILGRRAG